MRLLCATHADIPKAIAEGKFRHDLYYRINTVQIVLPPLRERPRGHSAAGRPFSREFLPTRWAKKFAPSRRARSINCWRTPGPAMSANWNMSSSAPWRWPTATRSPVLLSRRRRRRGEPAAAAGSGVSIPIGTTVDEATKRLVLATIDQCAGNKLKAARMLGHSAAHDVSAFLEPGGISGQPKARLPTSSSKTVGGGRLDFRFAKMAVAALSFWHHESVAPPAAKVFSFKIRPHQPHPKNFAGWHEVCVSA